MATELWLRNPQRSIRQALTEGVERFVFDQALLNHRRQSAHAFMREHFSGAGLNPEFIIVGDQGARLHNLFTEFANPLAVWPVWTFGDDLEVLEQYLQAPHGEDVLLCTDEEIESSVRPVYRQPHRVFIAGIKNPHLPVVAKQIAEVRALCNDYPEAETHLTGAQAFSLLFGWGWNSVDWSADPLRVNGTIQFPNGWVLGFADREKWDMYSDWVELVGWSMKKTSRLELVNFHLRSVKWAAENYTSDARYKRRFSPTSTELEGLAPSQMRSLTMQKTANWRRARTVAARALPMYESADGDKALCNHCVLRTSCNLARADMVCAIEGTEMGELAKYLGTRNTDSIIEGMLKLLSVQADRMEDALVDERNNGETSPEVTRQMNSVFKNAGVVAKLIDPNLNGKGTTITNQTLNVHGSPTAVSMTDPRQVMSAIVKELEQAGIPRNEITMDMIKGILSQSGQDAEQVSQRQAIEGAVVENTAKKE